MAQENPVAILNEFCQKNKLIYTFEKYDEKGMSHCKQFTMRLNMGKQGYNQFLEFFGTGNSLKQAKNDAAMKALSQKDLIDQIREVVTSKSKSVGYKPNTNTDSRVDDLATQISKIEFNQDKRDAIYESWLKAKKLNIRFQIDFIQARKGHSNTNIKVKITMGNQQFNGKSDTDLGAIYDAAEKIDLKKFEALCKIQVNEDDLSSDDDSSSQIAKLNELYQHFGKQVEYICLVPMLGQPQNPLFLYKCTFGDLGTYGLGGKKKTAKNNSARRMLSKLNESLEIENVKTQISNMDQWVNRQAHDRIIEALNLPDNAISVLEALDKVRPERTLKYTEISKQLGIQMYFTVECKLLEMPDLKLRNVPEDCRVEKNDLVYLKTYSKSTKKKTSKMEAAEKMVNLLKGDGPFTNEEVKQNKQLREFEEGLNVKDDMVNKDLISKMYRDVLSKIIKSAIQFMNIDKEDKKSYNPDYDFLAEIQDMEFEFRELLKLDIRSSNEVYSLFGNVSSNITCKVVVNLTCGITLAGYAECLDELEAKNKAAYQLLQKLVNLRNEFN